MWIHPRGPGDPADLGPLCTSPEVEVLPWRQGNAMSFEKLALSPVALGKVLTFGGSISSAAKFLQGFCERQREHLSNAWTWLANGKHFGYMQRHASPMPAVGDSNSRRQTLRVYFETHLRLKHRLPEGNAWHTEIVLRALDTTAFTIERPSSFHTT